MDFGRKHSAIRSMAQAIIVIAFILIDAYYLAIGITAYKAVEVFNDKCKGSIAFCAGKISKEFEEGFKEGVQ